MTTHDPFSCPLAVGEPDPVQSARFPCPGCQEPNRVPTRPARPDAAHTTLEGRSATDTVPAAQVARGAAETTTPGRSQGRTQRANRTEGLREQPARSPSLANPFADRRPMPNPLRGSR
jgi:hypothetical protein